MSDLSKYSSNPKLARRIAEIKEKRARNASLLHPKPTAEIVRPLKDVTEWKPDEERDACAVCEQKFSWFRRRHHCRVCGDVTCDSCSRSRWGGPDDRACDTCVNKNTVMLQKSLRVVKWTDDERRPRCRKCTCVFDMLNRKHHCRFCGEVYCSDCSAYVFPIKTQTGSVDYVRSCTTCFLRHIEAAKLRATAEEEEEALQAVAAIMAKEERPEAQEEKQSIPKRSSIPKKLAGPDWHIRVDQPGEVNDEIEPEAPSVILSEDQKRDSMMYEEEKHAEGEKLSHSIDHEDYDHSMIVDKERMNGEIEEKEQEEKSIGSAGNDDEFDMKQSLAIVRQCLDKEIEAKNPQFAHFDMSEFILELECLWMELDNEMEGSITQPQLKGVLRKTHQTDIESGIQEDKLDLVTQFIWKKSTVDCIGLSEEDSQHIVYYLDFMSFACYVLWELEGIEGHDILVI